MSGKTKAELEKEIVALKGAIRKLKAEAQQDKGPNVATRLMAFFNQPRFKLMPYRKQIVSEIYRLAKS